MAWVEKIELLKGKEDREGQDMKDCGLEDGSGSNLVEYILVVAVFALAIAATLSYLGIDLRSKYYQIIARCF